MSQLTSASPEFSQVQGVPININPKLAAFPGFTQLQGVPNEYQKYCLDFLFGDTINENIAELVKEFSKM